MSLFKVSKYKYRYDDVGIRITKTEVSRYNQNKTNFIIKGKACSNVVWCQTPILHNTFSTGVPSLKKKPFANYLNFIT